MSKHTPGPWVAEEHLERIITVETAQDEIYNRRDIAQVGFDPEERLTSEANARLIAAAPDLLAALERLLRWTNRGNADQHDKGCRCLIHEAEAAIAKATGTPTRGGREG